VTRTWMAAALLWGGVLSAQDDAANSDRDAAEPRTTVIVVIGKEGQPEFGPQFRAWAAAWEAAGLHGDAETFVIGRDAEDAANTDAQQLQERIVEHAQGPVRPLWIVLIGHGTFDGRTAKFNSRGPDFSGADLAEWLADVSSPIAIINCSSASAPFLSDLAAPGRVVVTATKSGAESNFTRFGKFAAEAIADLEADLDKDGQVSLLEVFLTAARRTQEYYDGESRLATEHALIDDDGDGLGTRSEAFVGVRPVRDAETGGLDGYRAHQWHLVRSETERAFPPDLRKRRDELELAVFQLRDRKANLPEETYFAQLENLLVELAELYEQADAAKPDELPATN